MIAGLVLLAIGVLILTKGDAIWRWWHR